MLKKNCPGLLLLLLVSILATGISYFLPPFMGRVALVVLIGIIINNTCRVPGICRPGIRLGLKRLLQLAIVLLGARIHFVEISRIGGRGLLSILLLISFTFAVTFFLGELLGISTKRKILIAVGMAICGNTAVVATAPLVEANEEDIVMAVSLVTLFGTLAVFVYPLFGLLVGMTDIHFGAWAGTAINDTSQVVAAGFSYSQEAGRIATMIKLTRNVLMAPIILLVSFFYGKKVRGQEEKASLSSLFPTFVLGFLVMAFLNTLNLIPLSLGEAIDALSSSLILLALAGIGLSVDLKSLKSIGYHPFVVGILTALSLALVSFLLNSWLLG